MTIFIKEENKQLYGNWYKIPDDVNDSNREILAKYKNCTKNKGYKRLNALVNPEYNKRSDEKFKDGKHISHTDAKRIKNTFDHMNNDPNNLDFVLNGGEKMKHFVDDTLNRERTKVKPVDIIPQVKDNNKNNLKPTISPMKPVKLGNIEATVHENKKIYINEKQLNMLNENIDK